MLATALGRVREANTQVKPRALSNVLGITCNASASLPQSTFWLSG